MSHPALPRPNYLLDAERLRRSRRFVAWRRLKDDGFRWACILVASISLLILAALLGTIFYKGFAHLDWRFLSSPPSAIIEEAGFQPALLGSIWLCVICGAITLPLGVSAAIFLEEFEPRKTAWKRINEIIQLNIANLAGVPSVVYGIIGLTIFVSMLGLFGTELAPKVELGVRSYEQFFNEADEVLLIPVGASEEPSPEVRAGMTALTVAGQEIAVNVIGPDAPWPEDALLAARTLRSTDTSSRIADPAWYYFRLPLGRSLLTGALTLMLVILPIVIIASQEALRAVPDSLREAALGMGATRWQVVWTVTLPAAMPGIMTGSIIAMSRAVGEAAPLLMIAGIVFISSPPGNLMDSFTAMPLQIYNWAQRPQEGFHLLASSGIMVLLAVLLVFNSIAVLIRQKLQKPLS